jgi:hypothetical protein
MHLHIDRSLKLRLIAGEALTQLPIEFGVTGFPEAIADLNAPQINISPPKRQ